MLKRFFLNLKGLSDASVASLTKKEYGSEVLFLNDLVQFVEVLFCLEFS